MQRVALSLLFLVVLMSSAAQAGPLSPARVPDPLKPWTDWVLPADQDCPYLDGMGDSRICSWSSKLTLSLSEGSGSFDQQWRVFADTWIPLPGNMDQWPLDVKADNQPAAVVLIESQPAVFLRKGEHIVTGSFLWDSLPESFQVPRDTGILRLTVKGSEIPFPSVDENGLVWLQGKEQKQEAQDSLAIRVHRLMDDDVPFVLTTHISLDVSGKTREVLLGPAVLERFTPMSIESPLPADVQPDGLLRVQARAGQWEITVASRHQGPVSTLKMPSAQAATPAVYWSEEEVWVFQAHNDLRLVSVQGVAAVDPQQTTLPDEWKTLPAYRVTPGDTVKLAEQRRGDSSPAPDQLALNRNYWLDFDGNGFTVNDQIAGTLSSGWRLEMTDLMTLGRASVNGDNQLITKMPGRDFKGFEIRHGQVEIVADSRFEGGKLTVPAVGWDHDFQRVSGILHLPPGWKLFAVTGADHVPSSWINRWTLLEIFLVLVLTASFAKVWGGSWGILAFFALVFSFPERDSPQWIWLAVLVASVLVRLIHKGRFAAFLRLIRLATLVILIVICLPFMVQQVRLALYPSLEYTQQINTNQTLGAAELEQQIQQRNYSMSGSLESLGYIEGGYAKQKSMPMAPGAPALSVAPNEEVPQQEAKPVPGKVMERARITQQDAIQTANVQSYKSLNPGALVQTGPGLPRWEGNLVALQWTGPVKKDQRLRFFLIPPFANLLLSFLRVLLVALLVLCVIGLPGSFWPNGLRKYLSPDTRAAGLILAAVLCFWGATEAGAEIPSPEMLQDLKQRLTENQECYPSCASISRMHVDVADNALVIRLEVAAQDQTALPLPGSASDWSPQQAMIDGKAAGLYRDENGKLWLNLSPGVHQLILEGRMPHRTTVLIPLPMKPHHVQARVSGWELDGLNEDGQVEENLQFTRLDNSSIDKGEKANQSGSLPPFVVVQRRLVLGMNWQMQTQVIRRTPSGAAVILEIPLLDGESVTTPGLRIQNGKIQINMPPMVDQAQWNSVLKQSAAIHLKAPESPAWMEVWQLDATPLWHITLEGIPVIHQQSTEGTWLPEWHPWPGEQVKISVIRPEGVAGQTLTVDQSLLTVTPGLRYSEASLNLSLRSSLGAQHAVALPSGAELQSVSINGMVQPLRQVEQNVTLPLTPGEQRVELKWQQPGGIRSLFRSPIVNLGLTSVNAETQFHLPPDRWILFAGGPGVGPAILFWGFLVVLVLVSFGLGRIPITPLQARHWLLLGLGLSQIPVWGSVTIACWLFVLGWRRDRPQAGKYAFDFIQLILVPWTLTALVILFVSVKQGLLGVPDMQIQGNSSTPLLLRWFQDRSPEVLIRPWVFSLPLFWYRLGMLAWALWLATALIGWLKWAWQCYSASGLWMPLRKKKATPPPIEPDAPKPDSGGDSGSAPHPGS